MEQNNPIDLARRPTQPIESPYQKLLFTSLAIALSIFIFLAYLRNTSIGAFQPASLARMLEGSATRPYAYRILVPVLARFLAPVVPSQIPDWFAGSSGAVRSTFEHLSTGGYAREAVIVMTIMLLCLAGFVFAERRLLFELGFGAREQFAWPLAILCMVLPITLFTGFYYDFPQLLLITISLILMYRKSWPSYLLVLAVANLNKETSVFLLVIFSLYYWRRLPHEDFFKIMLLQITICTAIRGAILYRFEGNPGASVLFTLPDQVILFQDKPMGIVFTGLYFAFAIGLAVNRWSQKHEFLRSASVLGIIILGLFFISGFPLEFRVFLDALPVLGILFFPPAFQQTIIDKPNLTA